MTSHTESYEYGFLESRGLQETIGREEIESGNDRRLGKRRGQEDSRGWEGEKEEGEEDADGNKYGGSQDGDNKWRCVHPSLSLQDDRRVRVQYTEGVDGDKEWYADSEWDIKEKVGWKKEKDTTQEIHE